MCTPLLLWFYLSPTPLNAQRAERDNINDTGKFSQADRELLFAYMQEWIRANEWIINYHGEFFGPIHSPQVNLPWHRAHVREIESFLLKKPGGAAFVPLPKWRPNPNGTYTILEPFTNYYADGVDPLLGSGNNPDSDYKADDFDNFICDQGSTSIAFANNWDDFYHSPGHGIIGGDFDDFYLNTGFPLFWLYHADMDDAWYRWERDCTHAYDVAPSNPANPTVSITSYVVWDEPMMVKGIVEIENNATLYIDSDAVVQFRSTDYEAYPTKIVVKSGGKLHIDGAHLKGIDRAVSSGSSGLRYNTNWQGIEVHHGGILVIENSAIIEQAAKAVTIGGTNNAITIKNSTFKNNRKSIVAHNKVNKLEITGCDFLNDNYLRDVIWGTTITTTNPLEVEIHFDHCITHSTERHIELINCWDVIIESCEFIQTYTDPHLNNISTGIFSSDAHVQVNSCGFKNLWHGMMVYNGGGGPRGRVKVSQNCTFLNNKYGIHGINADMMLIENSIFTMLDPALSLIDEDEGVFDCPEHSGHEHNRHPHVQSVAIRMSSGSSAYIIRNNSFFGPKDEFEAMAVKSGPSRARHIQLVHGNEFDGISNSIQIGGTHTYYQMPCNEFNYALPPFIAGLNTHMGVEHNGKIPHQGSFNQPTANILGISCNLFQQFYHANTQESINYYFFNNSDHQLLCNTTNVTGIEMDNPYDPQTGYCDRITTCFQVPRRDCIQSRVVEHDERRKEVLEDGHLTTEEKENQVNLIETDMRRIVYEGIHMMMDSSDYTELGILLDSIAIFIPDFDIDRDIYYIRKDTTATIRLLSAYTDFISDDSCNECDTTKLHDLIEIDAKAPAQEVVFLEVPTSLGRPSSPESELEILEGRVIWPNPANQTLFVSIEESVESIIIRAISGKIRYRQNELYPGIFQIDLSGYLPGLYIVSLHKENGESSHTKLVVK